MTEDQYEKAHDLKAQIRGLKTFGNLGSDKNLIYHPFPNSAAAETPDLRNLMDRCNTVWNEGIQKLIKNRQLEIEKI